MKILLCAMMLMLTSVGPVQEVKEEFDETCQNGYEEYYVMDEQDLDAYSIKIVIGHIDENVSHSLMFVSNNAKEYSVAIQYEDSEEYYYPNTNSRGDILLYNIPCDKSVEIIVLKSDVKTTSYTLTKMNYTLFQETFTNLLTGLGNGLPKYSVNDEGNSMIYILSLVFSIIIIISIITILVVYTKKKGLFNKKTFDERFEKEHEMRNQINQVIKNIRNNIEVEAEEVKEDSFEQQPKQVYEKPKYDFEEERNISLLLQEKGFNTDYKEMETEDKNKVMLELMRMRDYKEITIEEYRSEVIKLWM